MISRYVNRRIYVNGHELFSKSVHNYTTPIQLSAADVKAFKQIPKQVQNPVFHTLRSAVEAVLGTEKHKENFRRDLYFEKLHRKYGAIVSRGELFGRKTVHLFDPNDAEIVFRSEDSMPHRIGFDTVGLARRHIREVMRKPGITDGNGKDWQDLRTKFQSPLLRTKNVENFCTRMDTVAVDFVDKIVELINDNGEMKDLAHELLKWSIESIGLVIFDQRLGALGRNLSPDSDAEKLIDALLTSFLMIYKCELGIPWHRLFTTSSFKKLINAQRFLAELATKYIEATLAKTRNLPEDELKNSNFFFRMLVQKTVHFDDLVAVITDSLFGGIDTTAHSTAMLLYQLAKNQQVQEKLYQEVQSVLPDSSATVTADHINKMPYLNGCFKEIHRFTPVVDAVSRVLKTDLVLSGYNVPAGTNVIIHHRTMGRTCYDDPNEFKPERWFREHPGDRKYHRFQWLPFGFGLRSCVGRRIAEQETYLLIIRVLQKYRLTYNGCEEVHLVSQFVNVPDKPFKIQFNPR